MNRTPRGHSHGRSGSTLAGSNPVQRFLRGAAWVVPALLLAACGGDAEDAGAPADGAAGDVQAFTNANIFDGTGAPIVQNGTILVQGGKITAVGAAADVSVPEGVEPVDLGGRYVVPGFINAHAHVDNASGQGMSAQEQLEVYAHYGVTTNLSQGEETKDALNLREHSWTDQSEHARILASGRIYTPMTPEDAVAVVDSLAAQNVDYVKIRVDSFLGTREKMPPEAYQALIARATEHGIPVAVHMVELEDAKGVLEAGAKLISHSVRDTTVDQEFIGLLTQNDVCVVPTLTREMSTFAYAERPEWFDDPFFREKAAPSDLEGFLTPQLQATQDTSSGAVYYREHLPVAEENLRLLNDAGVRIAFGTDTGIGFPGRFQGYLEHLELQMMVDAGMTPEEALLSATGTTASCLGLEGQVGTLVPGAWADFIVLNANPVEDIANTKQVHGVWISGDQFR